ncbi:hypothetical protein Lal_00014018 [Lupinus albus]|nr:hypothetical protein Lal_00014018 [Lupinus albus]
MSVTPANVLSTLDGAGNPVSPSLVNTYRINAVAERLASYFQRGNRYEPFEIYHLCLSLSRGIDYALANGEIPDKAQELSALMQQICQCKNDEHIHAAVMVLMISVKNACEIGWFGTKEAQELLKCADEPGYGACPVDFHITKNTVRKEKIDPGPQMPTNVTGMLKFGTNLLQAVGQFNGEELKSVFPFLSSWLSVYLSH